MREEYDIKNLNPRKNPYIEKIAAQGKDKVVYPVYVTITDDSDNCVLVEVPDLKILTEGFSVENALVMAADAMKEKCKSYLATKEDIPAPSSYYDLGVERATFYSDGKTELCFVAMDLTE